MYKNSNNSSIACRLVEVNPNKPIKGMLKDFHPEAAFTVKLRPGDQIVHKQRPLTFTIHSSVVVGSTFVVGTINSKYVVVYPDTFSTFEDAILKGFILKIKLNDVTKRFWI